MRPSRWLATPFAALGLAASVLVGVPDLAAGSAAPAAYTRTGAHIAAAGRHGVHPATVTEDEGPRGQARPVDFRSHPSRPGAGHADESRRQPGPSGPGPSGLAGLSGSSGSSSGSLPSGFSHSGFSGSGSSGSGRPAGSAGPLYPSGPDATAPAGPHGSDGPAEAGRPDGSRGADRPDRAGHPHEAGRPGGVALPGGAAAADGPSGPGHPGGSACLGLLPPPYAYAARAYYFCGDWRLGPAHLPTKGLIGYILRGYHRFGTLTPVEFLNKYWDPAANGGQGDWIFPPKSGFQLDKNGDPIEGTQKLLVGEKLDRFGAETGRFLSPAGAPYRERALPPSNLDTTDPRYPFNYHLYRVAKEFTVAAGPIAPWFEQPGQGVQYMVNQNSVPSVPAGTFVNVDYLVRNGYLVRLN